MSRTKKTTSKTVAEERRATVFQLMEKGKKKNGVFWQQIENVGSLRL